MKKASLFFMATALALSFTWPHLGEAAGKGNPGGGGSLEPAIAYVAIQGAGTKIMVANTDGSNRIVVVDNGKSNSRPSWSPDGQRIVFTSDVNGPGVYCVTIDRSTGQPRHAPSKIVELSGDGRWWAKPVWSPTPVPFNGGMHKIAYANSNASGSLSIFLRDITDCQAPLGTPIEVRNLSDPHYRHYVNPSWSPDSDKLAVLAMVDGDQPGAPYYDAQIVTLGLCGGTLCDTNWQSLINGTEGGSPLTDATTNLYAPEWGRVAGMDFITLDANLDLLGDGDLNVWIVPADDPASAAVLTTETSDRDDYSPSWSPDNTEIVYSSRLTNTCKQVCQGTQIIVKRKVDGSGYKELIKEKYHVTQPKWWGPELIP